MTRSEAGRLGYIKAKEKLDSCIKKQQAEARTRWVSANCLACGKEIPYEKRRTKFCNSSCAASFNNRGVQRNGNRDTEINPERKCLNCGIDVKSGRKFCTYQCQHDFDFKSREAKILATGNLWEGWQQEKSIRTYLLKTKLHQCEICKGVEWQGRPTPLVMDHIDGNPINWDIHNLRLICPNCDALQPTFAGRNLGKGRQSRRRTYKKLGYC